MMPQWSVGESGEPVEDVASVTIHDPQLCGRFVARVLRDVVVGESPAWMQLRLSLCGMRPINSVVDVSNYVMLELGTPNHTYDLAKVPNGHLGVRRASESEELVTLDDGMRTLTGADGVIVDDTDSAIGIAGVMGGASTEISDITTEVLLELAWWWPRPIAETSTRLNLRSEASTRFERGTDWALNVNAVNRFCDLMAAQGATVAPGHIDVWGEVPSRAVVELRTSRVNHLLGTDMSRDHVASLLEPIGFDTEPVRKRCPRHGGAELPARHHHRDRHHRRSRSALRLCNDREDGAEVARCRPSLCLSAGTSRPTRLVGRRWIQRDHSDAVPRAGRPRQNRSLHRRSCDPGEPARRRRGCVAAVVAPRCDGGGRVQRVAQEPRCSPVRDRAHLHASSRRRDLA